MPKYIVGLFFALIVSWGLVPGDANAQGWGGCFWGCSPLDSGSGYVYLKTKGHGANVDLSATLELQGYCKPPTATEELCQDAGTGNLTSVSMIPIELTLTEGAQSGLYEFDVNLEAYTNHEHPQHMHTCVQPSKVEIRRSFAPFRISGTWQRMGNGQQKESGVFDCAWDCAVDPDTCEAPLGCGFTCDQQCFDAKGDEFPCDGSIPSEG